MEHDLLTEILVVERELRLSLEAEESKATALLEAARAQAAETLKTALETAKAEAAEAEAEAVATARAEALKTQDAAGQKAASLLGLEQAQIADLVRTHLSKILPESKP